MKFISFLRRKRCFSLVEIIIVATILAIISAAITASFMSGARLWGRIKNYEFKRIYVLLVIEQFARNFRQYVEVGDFGDTLAKDEMAFFTVSKDEIVGVKYKFDRLNRRLFKDEVKLTEIYSKPDEPVEYHKQVVLENVDDVYFKYLYLNPESKNYEWVSNIEVKGQPYKAVAFNVIAGKDNFRKIVFRNENIN